MKALRQGSAGARRASRGERKGKIRPTSERRAFTLIELLVVVAILALLVSILLPSLQKAKSLARAAICMTNLRGILTASSCYAADNFETLPAWNYYSDKKDHWTHQLAIYINRSVDVSNPDQRNIPLYQCPESADELVQQQTVAWWKDQMPVTYGMSYLGSCTDFSNPAHFDKYRYLKESMLASTSEFLLYADTLAPGIYVPTVSKWTYPWYFNHESTGYRPGWKYMVGWRHSSQSPFELADPNALSNCVFLDAHVEAMNSENFAQYNPTQANAKSLHFP